LSESEAQTFIDLLEEDIFDILLNEFIIRSKLHKKYSYFIHVGINFTNVDVPMDPYLIGYWLGDGTSRDSSITTADPEIVVEFYRILDSYDMTLNERGNLHYYIRGKGKYHRKNNTFLKVLRELNMINNKHIPDVYKCNSQKIRAKILAGLIDSDGYASNGYIEIMQKNKKLAADIVYLAYSLGLMVTQVECTKGCMYKGEMRNGLYQRINIFGDGLESIPVILERKITPLRNINKRATCISFDVKPKDKGEYYGLILDGDGRFLLDDFLITHDAT
jgi:hypothetical protein